MRRRVSAALAAVLLGPLLALATWSAPATAASAPPRPFSYWLAGADGSVFSMGAMAYAGSAAGIPLNRPIVGMAGAPGGGGYWLVASDGGVFTFGSARFRGSMGNKHLNRPIVDQVAKSVQGYWQVASDGGIFSFGDAQFHGSTGSIRLNRPIVGMTPTPSGEGYWLVASDGGIFAFGDARFFGSTGSIRLNRPIVGMASTASGRGYWMVASDGGIFAFGDARFYGSTGNIRLNRPIVGMARTRTGGGYWLAASDGGIFAFGSAPFRGSVGGLPLRGPIVDIASGPSTNPYAPGSHGYDISWPQCGGAYPARPFAFGIVGTTRGSPFTANPCFASQWKWAGGGGSVYVVLSSPTGPSAGQGATGPAGTCGANFRCQSYNFGFKAARHAVSVVRGAGAAPVMWWLDVETPKPWSGDKAANARVVKGAFDALRGLGHTVGIYSTSYQWGVITGGYRLGVPIWVAGATASNPAAHCHPSKAFNGGPTWLTQYVQQYDNDYACN